MREKLLPLILVIFALLSCKNEDKVGDTWFGGQIVNPRMDYIVFSQGSLVIDTIQLDSNNFFLYRSDKLSEGLYSIRHNESQVFYIQPGDSLLLHLNTIDFDESIAYSGKGSEQNNLLMDLYLKNERENNFLPNWYTLSPMEFSVKIDSIKAEKESEFNDFLSKNQVSEGFKEVAESSIQYDYFSKKELYAMANRERAELLDDTYFAYRKEIDFNKEKLRFYYPYYRFLNRYFNSLVVSKFPPGTDRKSYDFSMEKLKAINSAVSNDSIRNSLMRITAFQYLSCAKIPTEEMQFFEFFATLNNNPNHIEQIEELTKDVIRMAPGNEVPNIELLTMDNKIEELHNMVNSPTVLFFWTASSTTHAKMGHNRASELKSKFPEYKFIAINTDNHFKNWRQSVLNLSFDPNKEFQLNNVRESKKQLVLSSMMSKAVILDEKSVILDGNTNMFNGDFEQLLLGFLNRE